MKNKKILGVLLLLLAAFVWGFAFVAQREGMDDLTPSQFIAVRFILGAILLMPVVALSDFVSKGNCNGYWEAWKNKRLWLYGAVCGFFLGVASMLQQWGLVEASAGKGGFLTVLYIIGVPICGIFVGKKTSPLLWIAVLLAVAGSYFLCAPNGLGGGWKFCDTLLILCAIAFSFHILVIDKCVATVDAMRMSSLQALVTGIIGLVVSLVFGEKWQLSGVIGAMIPILYCAVCSTGIGYTCQFLGQRSVHPVAASLIMSLESVFAVLGGFLLLEEKMSQKELLGCLIIFIAVILAQIPTKKRY
jgi:drug/metabolite transporter (DMT)-like permease